uniref:hypothetical protein n=1 Tax=Ruminococcus sp. TaxID=41978 RepID=UPI003AF76091
DTIRPTAYLYVNYLGYDNNHWELQTCEEYDETVAEYVGNFNLDNIKQMFDFSEKICYNIIGRK